MPGEYLRTNYRRTGGIADITALGGGIPRASATSGGAGMEDGQMYGGFMYFSMAMTGGSGDNATGGREYAWGTSTFGTMSLYYGSGIYSGGFRFQPIGWIPMSISESTWANRNQSLAIGIKLVGTGTSDSIWRMSFAIRASGDADSYNLDTGSWCMCSATGLRLIVYGFIISGP